MKDLQQIFDKYPKAKESFEVYFIGEYCSVRAIETNGTERLLDAVVNNYVEAQTGFILAWMQSEGYVNLTIRLDDSVARLKAPCRIAIGGGVLPTILCDEKDFDTAYPIRNRRILQTNREAMKIILSPKALDRFTVWLSETTVFAITHPTMAKNPNALAVKIILSNPHIYGMVLIDWMRSKGYTEFEISEHSRKHLEVKMLAYTGQGRHEYFKKIGERTKAFCQLVEEFAKTEFKQ